MNLAHRDVRNVVFSMLAAGGSLAAFLGNLIAGFLQGLFARAMAVALFLRMIGETSYRVFYNVHMDLNLDASTGLIGSLSAAAQLAAIPAALLMPLLTRQLGRYRLFTAGLCGMAASLLLVGLIPHWAAAGTALVGVAAMHWVVGPTSVVFQQEIVPPEWREIISGATTMAIGIGSSGISLGGGYVLSLLGYRTLFLGGAASVALGALLFGFYFRIPRGEYGRRTGPPPAA